MQRTAARPAVACSLLAAVLLIPPAATARDAEVGDSREVVVREMGRPKGSLLKEDREILWYDRGSVELVDGSVVAVKLMTAFELREQRRVAEVRAREEAVRRGRYNEAGRAERDRMLNDTNFTSKSAAEQVSAWDEFQRKYPDVSVDEQTADVREKARADEEAARQAEVKQGEEKPKPKLSASKRRRYIRAGDTNKVDIASPDF